MEIDDFEVTSQTIRDIESLQQQFQFSEVSSQTIKDLELFEKEVVNYKEFVGEDDTNLTPQNSPLYITSLDIQKFVEETFLFHLRYVCKLKGILQTLYDKPIDFNECLHRFCNNTTKGLIKFEFSYARRPSLLTTICTWRIPSQDSLDHSVVTAMISLVEEWKESIFCLDFLKTQYPCVWENYSDSLVLGKNFFTYFQSAFDFDEATNTKKPQLYPATQWKIVINL